MLMLLYWTAHMDYPYIENVNNDLIDYHIVYAGVVYARPRWWNPLRYLWRPVLALLEPFALDLWRDDIRAWMPPSDSTRVKSRRLFGGLYQVVTATKGLG